MVNYDADFPVESVTSLSYLFVIFSSIHHFVDYKHDSPTRGTRVSYNQVPGFFFVQRSLRFFSYVPFVLCTVFLYFPPVDSTHSVVSSPLRAWVCNGSLIVSLTDTHRRTQTHNLILNGRCFCLLLYVFQLLCVLYCV